MRQRKQKSLSTYLVLWPVNICQLQVSNSWLSLVTPLHWDFPLCLLWALWLVSASSQLLPLPQPRSAGVLHLSAVLRGRESFSRWSTAAALQADLLASRKCQTYAAPSPHNAPTPNSRHTAAFRWEKDTISVCTDISRSDTLHSQELVLRIPF